IHQQTLAEATRAGKEPMIAPLDQIPNHRGFINIIALCFTQSGEVLNADGQTLTVYDLTPEGRSVKTTARCFIIACSLARIAVQNLARFDPNGSKQHIYRHLKQYRVSRMGI
ncbi:MAG: hypothetical protein OXC66_06635, partial [Roseovarius sp.]|nr:hypothetical protein [Roseovarius sp.]